MKKNVLVLGGAGFIGSHISKRFLDGGYQVVVIDGICSNCGGKKVNLQAIAKKIKFIHKRVEEVKNLNKYVHDADVIIDCMGWTLHLLAFKNPQYDLELNILSHLELIKALEKNPGKNIVYLGSRGQYGNPITEKITEEVKMEPLDIQGTNKLAAENYFRIFSKNFQFNVSSLRLGNCFGPNQIIDGEDIGLVGSFIRDSLRGKNIVLYGTNRKRAFVYVENVAEIVFRLAENLSLGFHAYNLVGTETYLLDLAKKIVRITKLGSVITEPMPEHIKRIDMGNAKVSEKKIQNKLGRLPRFNLNECLQETINYFKQNL